MLFMQPNGIKTNFEELLCLHSNHFKPIVNVATRSGIYHFYITSGLFTHIETQFYFVYHHLLQKPHLYMISVSSYQLYLSSFRKKKRNYFLRKSPICNLHVILRHLQLFFTKNLFEMQSRDSKLPSYISITSGLFTHIKKAK